MLVRRISNFPSLFRGDSLTRSGAMQHNVHLVLLSTVPFDNIGTVTSRLYPL